MEELTQNRLKELISYDAATGEFFRVRSIRAKLGRIAGSKNRGGYLMVSVDGKTYSFHRLAWLYSYGVLPDKCVDHIDGDRLNNRLVNLRLLTRAENIQNQWKANRKNKTGLLGVSPSPTKNRWYSMITINKKRIYLGSYGSPEDAHEAYLEAKAWLHPSSELAKQERYYAA